MNTLREEIIEMSKEGEILLAMDGNAKIGILGEPISRNGNLLLDVLKETNMKTLNNDPKCKGKVTRQNTKNKDEQSAIDFVVGSENMCQWVTEMVIDEEGLAKIKGKNETDHNTIIIDLNIRNIDRTFKVKHTSWNLRAGGEKWAAYAEQINAKVQQAIVIVNDDKKDINERYKLWSSEIEKSAWSTLGKTTYREKTKETFSEEVTELRKKKKTLKRQIQGTANHDEKTSLIDFYKIVQSNITDLIVKERTSKIEKKIQLILADNSRTSFWREKRSLSRNPALESLIIKDKTGNRIYAPEQIKEVTASYYENLYRNKNLPSRPYHIQLENRLTVYSNNREHESDLCNTPPTEAEISEIIENKKNGKSTTDFKNEMMKRPGEPMTKYIAVLIKTVWKEEKVPKDWKKGLVTSLWKGKGDRETLENHRGITVSSTIGNILEEIIDRRIQASVEFTQAQRGGLKGASTYDHIFILQSTIAIALKQKRKTYITYFDVQKAYDNVDNNDMLGVMWEAGLRGKVWRILQELCSELKASIKTRHGLTREISMEIGGKQGSKITGRMFSKLMDVLSELIIEKKMGFKMAEQFIIGALMWVDDVVTCVDGHANQIEMLQIINDFAKDHKLQWGVKKCKVMPIGKHNMQDKWPLGELEIDNCTEYKYLGDIISNNGKNKQNINDRKRKAIAATISINTVASNEILNCIETSVLVELHERITIPTLLNNAEAWVLQAYEIKEL